MKRWTHGNCQGGIMLDRDGSGVALIMVRPGEPPAYSTALKIARRMVRLLNSGEAALAGAPLEASPRQVERASSRDE
jgi:hypothetical protein